MQHSSINIFLSLLHEAFIRLTGHGSLATEAPHRIFLPDSKSLFLKSCFISHHFQGGRTPNKHVTYNDFLSNWDYNKRCINGLLKKRSNCAINYLEI